MEYRGIISGIGDLSRGINVINPKFDAKLNHFIIGQDTVLDGFRLSNGIFLAGECIAQGYRGIYNDNITLSSDEKYVYGKFIVHDNPDIPDEFWIITSATKLSYINDDILHGTGTYYLLLLRGNNINEIYTNNIDALLHDDGSKLVGQYTEEFKLGKVISIHCEPKSYSYNCKVSMSGNTIIVDITAPRDEGPFFEGELFVNYVDEAKTMPRNAYQSVVTETVASDGVLEDGVTATTKAVGDNSKNVATTEFVQKQIAKDIGTENRVFTNAYSSTVNITATVKYRARMCFLNIGIVGSGGSVDNQIENGATLITLPEKYIPTEKTSVMINVSTISGSSPTNLFPTLTVDTSGRVYIDKSFGFLSIGIPRIAYETKEI